MNTGFEKSKDQCSWFPDSRFAASGMTVPDSHPDLRDEFRVEIRLDRLGAAFGAVAGILHAAERHFRQRERDVIDRDHAALDRGADRGRGLRRSGEGVGRKPVGKAIGLADRAGKIRERRD